MVLSAAVFSLLSMTTPAMAETEAERAFALCERYAGRANYTKALEHCNRVRNYYRDQPESLGAELVIGDIYFKQADYEQARLSYEDFRRLHPSYPKYQAGKDGEPGRGLDYVVYREGLSLYKRSPRVPGRDQTATRSALATWAWCPPGAPLGDGQGFVRCFGESPYVDEVLPAEAASWEKLAEKELVVARYYATRGVWRAVADRCQGLTREYPTSAQVPEALALWAQAEHSLGNGETSRLILSRLEADYSDTIWTRSARAALSTPLGAPPIEQVFLRPHRITTSGMPGMGQ